MANLNRNWIIVSVFFHLLVVAALIFGLPERKKPLMPPPPIIIDLVTVSDKTRTTAIGPKEIVTKNVQKVAAPPAPAKPAVMQKPKPVEPIKKLEIKPLKKIEPTPIAKPTLKKPKEIAKLEPIKKIEPKKIEPKKIKMAKPKPEPKKPEPKKEPPKKVESKPAPTKPAPKVSEKPVEKPIKKVEPPKKDFSSLIRNSIDKNKPSPADGAGVKASAAGKELSDVLTVSQMAAVRQHIVRCWNITAIQGAQDLKFIEVKTQLTMNPDRTVQNLKILSGTGQQSPYYARMVETVERLFQRPGCGTLPLPAGQHNTWKNFQLTFDLKDQLGY